MDDMHDGILEDWGEGGGMIYGAIYYDSKNRFADGTFIRTSLVVSGWIEGSHGRIFRVGDVIQTLNSTYTLGMKAEGLTDE